MLPLQLLVPVLVEKEDDQWVVQYKRTHYLHRLQVQDQQGQDEGPEWVRQ